MILYVGKKPLSYVNGGFDKIVLKFTIFFLLYKIIVIIYYYIKNRKHSQNATQKFIMLIDKLYIYAVA